MLRKFVTGSNNIFTFFCQKNASALRHLFLNSLNWLPTYYTRVQKMWNEGLYADHLQKKVCDKFVRKVIIYTNNLFSESVVFRRVVDAYWVLITSPTFLKTVCPFNSPVFNFVWIISLLFTVVFLIIVYSYVIAHNINIF